MSTAGNSIVFLTLLFNHENMCDKLTSLYHHFFIVLSYAQEVKYRGVSKMDMLWECKIKQYVA